MTHSHHRSQLHRMWVLVCVVVCSFSTLNTDAASPSAPSSISTLLSSTLTSFLSYTPRAHPSHLAIESLHAVPRSAADTSSWSSAHQYYDLVRPKHERYRDDSSILTFLLTTTLLSSLFFFSLYRLSAYFHDLVCRPIVRKMMMKDAEEKMQKEEDDDESDFTMKQNGHSHINGELHSIPHDTILLNGHSHSLSASPASFSPATPYRSVSPPIVNQTWNGSSMSNDSGSGSASASAETTPQSCCRRIEIIPAIPSRRRGTGAAASPSHSAHRTSSSLIRSYLLSYSTAMLHVDSNPIATIEWHSRFVSTVHAVISVIMGIACVVWSGGNVDEGLMTTNTGASSSIAPVSFSHHFNPFSSTFTPSLLAFSESHMYDISLLITCGYLLYDLLLCLYVRASFSDRMLLYPSGIIAPVAIDDGLTLLHHILIIIAFSLGIYSHIGTYFMSCFLLNEVSTPFLNANFALASLGETWKVSRIYKVNGIVLFGVFFVMRVVWNMYVVAVMAYTWWELRALWISQNAASSTSSFFSSFLNNTPIDSVMFVKCLGLSLMACGHVAINLLWFSALYRAIRRKLFRKSTAPSISTAGAKKTQ